MAIQYGFWTYTSDSGKSAVIRIELNAGTAINGAPTGGSEELPPRRTKLRKIDLVKTAGGGALRKRIPAVSNTQANWTTPTPSTVSISGSTYKVAGRIGEKRF